MRIDRATIALLARFVVAGLVNTAVGTGIIVACLHFGLGDYPANACGYGVGFVVSYFLQRKWTFAVKRRATWAEVGRFGVAVALSYGVNLAVLATGRGAGFAGQPLLHVVAMAAYSATFFVISRFVVFAPERVEAAPAGKTS